MGVFYHLMLLVVPYIFQLEILSPQVLALEWLVRCTLVLSLVMGPSLRVLWPSVPL